MDAHRPPYRETTVGVVTGMPSANISSHRCGTPTFAPPRHLEWLGGANNDDNNAVETDWLLQQDYHRCDNGGQTTHSDAMARENAAISEEVQQEVSVHSVDGADGQQRAQNKCGCSHVAIMLSILGILISLVHLGIAIHQDAIDSARNVGYARGRAEARASWRNDSPPDLVTQYAYTCDMLRLTPEFARLFQHRPPHFAAHSSRNDPAFLPIAHPHIDLLVNFSAWDSARKGRWEQIWKLLNNITGHISKIHPDAADREQSDEDVDAIRQALLTLLRQQQSIANSTSEIQQDLSRLLTRPRSPEYGGSACEDAPFVDADGDSCAEYTLNSGWCEEAVEFANADGVSARDACCACSPLELSPAALVPASSSSSAAWYGSQATKEGSEEPPSALSPPRHFEDSSGDAHWVAAAPAGAKGGRRLPTQEWRRADADAGTQEEASALYDLLSLVRAEALRRGRAQRALDACLRGL